MPPFLNFAIYKQRQVKAGEFNSWKEFVNFISENIKLASNNKQNLSPEPTNCIFFWDSMIGLLW
jgi:hypothetical protein